MTEDNVSSGGLSGMIPDFFHDVIAYFVPGYTIITLLILNVFIVSGKFPFVPTDVGAVGFIFVSVIAYVIGRILEQLGYWSIHNKQFPFFGKKNKLITPKWSILFDEGDKKYTKKFKDNLETKLGKWLKKQGGKDLIEACKTNQKDDYFNLIQFYLRERFPQIALYEKKQNATIVLTRSLTVGFFLNIFMYLIALCILAPNHSFEINMVALTLTWVFTNGIFSIVFYHRFHLDKRYHAMYIFEAFIATRKLLKKSENEDDSKESTDK